MDSKTTEASREIELAVARRLEAIERENRRLRRLTGILLAGLAILLGLTASLLVVYAREATATADVIQAQRFVLRDQDGLIRAILGVQPDGSTRFALQDRDGRPRLQLTLLGDGSPGVALKDREGRNRAVLALPPDDMAQLVFADRDGYNRASLGLSVDHGSTLMLADPNGEPRAFLAVGVDGTPSLLLYERAAEHATGAAGTRPGAGASEGGEQPR